jgi:hypothetical protein
MDPTKLDPKKKKVLNLLPPRPGTPNEKVIKALRETLKEAKEGKIQAIGIAIALIDYPLRCRRMVSFSHSSRGRACIQDAP